MPRHGKSYGVTPVMPRVGDIPEGGRLRDGLAYESERPCPQERGPAVGTRRNSCDRLDKLAWRTAGRHRLHGFGAGKTDTSEIASSSDRPFVVIKKRRILWNTFAHCEVDR